MAIDSLPPEERAAKLLGIEFDAPRLSVRVRGVSRMLDNEKALLVSFDSEPTDDDIRAVHEVLRGRKAP